MVTHNLRLHPVSNIWQFVFYLGSTWHEEERQQVCLVFDRNLDVRGQHKAIEEKVISNGGRFRFDLRGVPLGSTSRATNVLTIVRPGAHHLVVRGLQDESHYVHVCSLPGLLSSRTPPS